jgi:hypothetical protein
MHFFHPVGYNKMDKEAKLKAKEDVLNWSDADTRDAFKEHLKAVHEKNKNKEHKAKGEIYVPKLTKSWINMSGQEKYEYLTNPAHWGYRKKAEYEAEKKNMM